MDRFAQTPEPPYFAVIFSNQHSDRLADYEQVAHRMVELATTMDGFLGVESTRDASGFGITVSYWRDEEAIAAWKSHAEHAIARRRGRTEWYKDFHLRVAKVERAYSLANAETGARKLL